MNPYQKNYLDLHKNSEKKKHEEAFLYQLKTLEIERPIREYQFRRDRRWRVDFAYPEKKLAIEIEGGLWRKDNNGNWAGAHSHPLNIERDIEKYNSLTMLGFRLLRFTDKHIRSGEASQMVKAYLIQYIINSRQGDENLL